MDPATPDPSRPAGSPGAATPGPAPAKGRGRTPRPRRRRWKRWIVLVPLILIGGTFVVLQTPAAAWIVEPVVAAQTGMDVETRSVRVSPLGTVVISGASLDAPDIDGVPGRVLTVDRITARIDWTATLAGSPGLKDLRLVGPTLRLSQDADTGVLNAAAFRMLGGGGGGGATPSVTVRDGAIELGEHSGETYTRLRRWSVIGEIDPADADGVSAFSFAAVPAEASMGGSPSGSLGLDGTIGPDGVAATLDGLALEDWPASIVPSRLRTIYARLDLSGRLLPTRFTLDPDGRVAVRMTLDGVDLNLPFNEAYSLEGGGELLRMRQTRGTIEFGADGLAADVSGLIDELRYDVELDYRGLTADAPFTTELTTRFRMDDRFRPRRFLPPKAIEKLEMFDSPVADVDAVVRVSRPSEGAPIGVDGRATIANGSATYAKFRYPFTNLEGTVAFTRDDLVIERITGRGPTGAALAAEGRFEGLGQEARVVITVNVRGVPIDQHLYAALSSGQRQLVEALFNTRQYQALLADGLIRTPDGRGRPPGTPVFAYGGAADVDLTLTRHPDRPENDRWTRETIVRLDRAGLVPEHFPLPIVARGIELRINDDQFTLTGGRYEGLTGGEAFVQAALDQTQTRPGMDPLPIVEIQARGIPVDARLLAAIPGYRDPPNPDQPVSLRSILDNLRISGTVECRAVIGPRSDGTLGYDVEANLDNATARPNAALPGAPDTPPGAGAVSGETDPLVLAGMTGIVYVTERLIVVDFRGELQSPGRPLAPTPITLLTQLTLPERRGGLGDVARVGGLLPIQQGPPVPGPGLYATARADGLDLAMPLEYAAAVVSPELARRLADLRRARNPDGVVALRTEIDGIVGGHSEITLGVDRIRSLAFDHQSVRHRLGQSRGTIELQLGVRPHVRFSGFRVPVASGDVDAGEIALNGQMPLIPPGEAAWRPPGADAGPLPWVTASIRDGRIESPATAQIVGAFAGDRVADWIAASRVAGSFDLDLRLSPLVDAAPTRLQTGTEADRYAIPALSALGTLRPSTLALDLPESRLVFETVEGSVLFEGLGGRVENLRAQAPGLRIAADGPWTYSPGQGAGMDLAIEVEGDRLDEQVRTLLPGVVLGVLDRFEVGVDGPLATEGLRLTAAGLGADNAELTIRGSAAFTGGRALVGLPITEITGSLDFEADVRPGGVGYNLELEADRLRAGRLRVEDARATILADESRPGVVLIPSITGRLHGGRIAGSAQTRTGDPAAAPPPPGVPGDSESATRYWIDLHASDVRAAPVFDDLLLPPDGLVGPPLPGDETVRSAWAVSDDYTRGLLDADLSLTGVAGDPSRTTGRGVVRVAGGSVIALPGLINLIEFSNLRAPLGAQLDLAEGVFYVDGTTVAFERLSASSRSVEILGHGTMDWTTQELDLRFRSRAIRPVPFFSGVLEQIRDELITTKITGRPGDLDYSAENFGSTRRLIGALLGEPETEQERVMSAVEQASRASKNRDPGRAPPPVMPTRSPGQPDRPDQP